MKFSDGPPAMNWVEKITKDGDEDNPAYLIKQEDGDEVLKRGSELQAQN